MSSEVADSAIDVPIVTADGAAGSMDGADVAGEAPGSTVDAPDGPTDAPVILDTSIDSVVIDTTHWDGGGSDTPGVSAVPDYLIIAADELADSALRYRDFRVSSGFNVDLAMVGAIVGDADSATTAVARIIEHVRARYQARDTTRPMYLLLLGDAQDVWPGDGTGVPTGTWQAVDGGAPVVSDNVFADMDGDDVPDLAVGRITADDDDQADLVRGKVVDYETTHEIGQWDRRINIFASTSGFGALADTAIETLVYDTIEALPYDYDMTMTYANQTSPYVYVPEQFSAQVYRRINEGSLLVGYVGHGYADGFAKLDWNGTSYPILDTDALDSLAVTHRSPILLFVACSTGAFAGGDSVSERILARADAPAAILSATEISHPYASAILTHEFMQLLAKSHVPRLGEAFMLAKQRMLAGTDSVRNQIEILTSLLVSATEKEALKHSHLHMFTLFGDPAMHITYPGKAEVAVEPATAGVGANLTVTLGYPVLGAGGQALVTLESLRKTILGPIALVPADDDPSRDSVIVENYETANDKVVASATIAATGSSVSLSLQVPPGLPAGQYHVKAFIRDQSSDYMGSAAVTVP